MKIKKELKQILQMRSIHDFAFKNMEGCVILNTKNKMLEIRPTCEHCNKSLPYHSSEAMICTFECTFCKDCVEHVLQHVCSNCGGGFEKRPIRPENLLENNPVSTKVVYKPVDVEAHLKRINKQ